MTNENNSLLKKSWSSPVMIAAVLLAVSITPAFFVPETITATLTKIAIMALFATSLNIQLGYGGMRAMGHAMYFGLGSYIFTVLTTRADISILPSFFITMAASVVLAMFIGYICLRNDMMGFTFLNMGISLLIYSFVYKWMWIGADGGLLNTPRPSFAMDTVSYHIFAIIIIAVCIGLLYLFKLSPFTNILKGCRENDERLLFLGISTKTVRWFAHVISALFAVVAGILFAMRNSGAYPTNLANLVSTEALIMCIIGGMNNFMGPILGAAIVTVINTVISNQTIYYQLILGSIILICVLFIRGGILVRRGKKKNKQIQLSDTIKI